MSQALINRSLDLQRLRDDGYEIEVKGPYLLAHQIPYLNSSREPNFGSLVTELTISGDVTVRPGSHVIYFVGEHPCHNDGTQLTEISHQTYDQTLYPGVCINHAFSSKPSVGYYDDHYHKISRYADIISAPAKSLNPAVSEKTFKKLLDTDDVSPFHYLDTNSGRAKIHQISAKLSGQRIAIVGLGGTGAYILDAIAKTPVAAIHLFDGDVFQAHNAFRSPGAASVDQLNAQPMKVAYYAEIYSKMHRHVIPHAYYIHADTMRELAQMDFLFICVDNNVVRAQLAVYLSGQGQSFIDVGLGIEISGDSLIGLVRVTTSTSAKSNHLPARLPAGEQVDNAYASNIQIAELNALNAILAIIKWKKLSGFYQDADQEFHSVYSVYLSEILNEDQSLTT